MAERFALPAGGWDEKTPFDGTNFKPHKLPENAQTPTRRVHAVLGGNLFLFGSSVFFALPAILAVSFLGSVDIAFLQG